MPTDATRATVHAIFETFAAHDLDAFRTFLTDDVVLRDPPSGMVHEGPEALMAAVGATVQAFPDLEPEVTNIVVEGEQAVAEVMRTATHTGPLPTPDGPVPPTGRAVRMPECIVFRITDGKVASMTTYLDRLSILQQLGLIKDAEL
jgi:steroid delta-isomerase-like uncharacterized protein